MKIKKGDRLKHKLNDIYYLAISDQTNSGEVLVSSKDRLLAFYIRAEVVDKVPNEQKESE